MEFVNYHTHTWRCQHATGTDREYVEQAIMEGVFTLGFSDHTPWPYGKGGFVSHIRMGEDELEAYVASIQSLRQEYQDRITIKVGLECESFPEYFPWLAELVRTYQLDYLILGNHFSGTERDGLCYSKATRPDDLYDYVEKLETAVRTGMFFYIAHPDIVFSSYPVFDQACEIVSRAICTLAVTSDIPLEYNLSGIWKREEDGFRGLGYPCRSFWAIAREYHPKVIVGLDAHAPRRIDKDFFMKEAERLVARGFHVIA